MPFLFHQFLLNKILSTTNTPKNYAVWNISWLSNSLEQLHLKNKKEIDDFLPFKQRIKEKNNGTNSNSNNNSSSKEKNINSSNITSR